MASSKYALRASPLFWFSGERIIVPAALRRLHRTCYNAQRVLLRAADVRAADNKQHGAVLARRMRLTCKYRQSLRHFGRLSSGIIAICLFSAMARFDAAPLRTTFRFMTVKSRLACTVV